MVASKIYSRVILISIIIIIFIAAAMGHPTNGTGYAGINCTGEHGHTGPPMADAPTDGFPMGGPRNHSIGFVGQQRNMSLYGASAKQSGHHEDSEPCMSEGAKTDAIASKIILATLIAITLVVVLSM
ncbi:uncharacterized protein F4807DRAFT_469015 [Annulohypoxylon truncatum]|uniref:uncharacterized protein n=1 Tax=Annulohypoxylon truncatum TaxID=327061 RepID=UPI002007940B|nr:uncharacterized protein F4807DRAFT_469015 [Annulohypoxylon truncatum]KAI1207797.1 hypothetical protein F4807DRAFT_469015 [Annulohypoxylon truncatum]